MSPELDGGSGAELSKAVVVRFGSAANGAASDIWFDNLVVAARPLP